MNPPTFSNAARDQAPSPCSCMEIASVIVFTFAILFGIGSFISALIDWIYLGIAYLEYSSASVISAICLGVLFEILGIIAIPLAFAAAQTYLRDRNALGVSSGPCITGWHIAAWIIYGIVTAMGLACLILGFIWGFLPFYWLAVNIVLWVIAWGLMIQYTELARRRQSNTFTFSENSNGDGLTVISGDASVPKKAFRNTPVATTPTIDPTEGMEEASGTVSASRQDKTLYASAVEVEPNAGGYQLTVNDQFQTTYGEAPWIAAATASNKKRASTLDP